jgi:hypothetical protein
MKARRRLQAAREASRSLDIDDVFVNTQSVELFCGEILRRAGNPLIAGPLGPAAAHMQKKLNDTGPRP